MQFRYNPRAYYIGGVYSIEDWQEGPNSCASPGEKASNAQQCKGRKGD